MCFWSPFAPWLGGALALVWLTTLSSLLSTQLPRRPLLLASGLTLLGFMSWQVAYKGSPLPDWLEHTLSWSTPLLLWVALRQPTRWPLLAKMAIAATFTGHGLYALGWPAPTPPHFLFMTQQTLSLSVPDATALLRIAGGLDLLVSLGLFLPRVSRLALGYAVLWGSLTALARPVAYVALETVGPDLHRWAMELVWRMPHALVPLALLGSRAR